MPLDTRLADRRPHLAAADRVEAGGGLVEEEHLGVGDQAGGEVEPGVACRLSTLFTS